MPSQFESGDLITGRGIRTMDPRGQTDAFYFDGRVLRLDLHANAGETGPALQLNRLDTSNAPTQIFAINKDGSFSWSGSVFYIADGTAGAPGLAFDLDRDTGMYRTADNTISFAVGGVRTLLLASGTVQTAGAGTPTAPSFAFVNDTDTGLFNVSADVLGITAGGVEVARFETAASGVNFLRFSARATGAAPFIISGGSDTNIPIELYSKGTGSVSFYTNAANKQFEASHTASAVNYIRVTGSATGARVVISAQGSDTNIPLELIPKGSSGVVMTFGVGTGGLTLIGGAQTLNLRELSTTTHAYMAWQDLNSVRKGYLGFASNGAASFTWANEVVNGGFIFTPNGTGIVDIQTGASGFTQFGSAQVNTLRLSGAATTGKPLILATGSDTDVAMSLSGKGTGVQVVIRGNSNNGDIAQFVGVASHVNYLIIQSAVTGSPAEIKGDGTDANVGVSIRSKAAGSVTIATGGGSRTVGNFIDTASSVNYIQFNANATTQPPAIQAVGTDANISLIISAKGTGNTVLATGSASITGISVSHTASGVNYFTAIPATTGNDVSFGAAGSDTNVTLTLRSKGTGSVQIRTNGGNNTAAQFLDVASSVNFVTIQGSATAQDPRISAAGSDTNVSLVLTSKGTGWVKINSGGASRTLGQFKDATSAVNYFTTTPGATGTGVTLAAEGSDSNIDIILSPKGTGVVRNGTGITRKQMVPLADFLVHSGAPTRTTRGTNVRYQSWRLVNGSTNGITGQLPVPYDWRSGTQVWINLWVTGTSATTANVALELGRMLTTVPLNGTLNTLPASSISAVPVSFSAAEDLKQANHVTVAVTPSTVDELIEIELERIGADAADTYTGDLDIVGVDIEYTANL